MRFFKWFTDTFFAELYFIFVWQARVTTTRIEKLIIQKVSERLNLLYILYSPEKQIVSKVGPKRKIDLYDYHLSLFCYKDKETSYFMWIHCTKDTW